MNARRVRHSQVVNWYMYYLIFKMEIIKFLKPHIICSLKSPLEPKIYYYCTIVV